MSTTEYHPRMEKGDDAFPSREEIAYFQRIFRHPEILPEQFWRAVYSKVALNGEPIPQSQVTGLSQNFAKIQASGNTLVDITNTTSAKSLYDGATHSASTGWTIPAGIMGSNRMIRLSILGDALYNNVDGDNCSLTVYVGNAALVTYTDMFSPGLPSASREQWSCTVEVINTSTDSQISRIMASARTFNSTTGTTLGSVNTTQSWQLDVTATWTAASTGLSLRSYAWVMELV